MEMMVCDNNQDNNVAHSGDEDLVVNDQQGGNEPGNHGEEDDQQAADGGEGHEMVRSMFVQMLRRLNVYRNELADEKRMALTDVMEEADRMRLQVFESSLEGFRIQNGGGNRRIGSIFHRGGPPLPTTVLSCSACYTPIVRPSDVVMKRSIMEGGPEVVLCDDPQRKFEVYTSACNTINDGELYTCSPCTQPEWTYRCKLVRCPGCRRSLGVKLISVAFDPEKKTVENGTGQGGSSRRRALSLDGCEFPSIIKATALFKSPRIIRPNEEVFLRQFPNKFGQDDDGNFLVGTTPILNQYTLCGKYLSLRNVHSGSAVSGRPKTLILCNHVYGNGDRCCQILTDHAQILGTKGQWKGSSQTRGIVDVFHVNALKPGSFHTLDQRVETLNKEKLFLQDVLCSSCNQIVGYEILDDISIARKSVHQVHRFSIFAENISIHQVCK